MARIGGAAARLREAGVGPGDRVLLCAPNSPAVPVLYFAIHAAGAVAVVVAPDMPAPSVEGVATAAGVRLALVERDDLSAKISTLSASETAAAEGELTFDAPDLGAPADLLFTSGTTGKKKGVRLTHRNIAAAGRNIATFLRIEPTDIQAVPLPLSHSFGLGCVRSLAFAGHTLLIERGLVNPAAMLKRMTTLGATGLAVVPSGVDVIRRTTGDALGALRDQLKFVELGSAAISPENRAWLMEMLPHTRLCHHYGMTEASRAAFIEYHADKERLGTVGRASPNVEITILDAEGAPVAAGETGAIVVSGEVVTGGYWEDPELTASRISPAGLITGDIGRLDADGYLHLLGRQDDIINVGGRKVAPDEVEAVLLAHPDITDAACVPMADPVLGQAVAAHVVVHGALDVEAVAAWARERLEDYKVPRAVLAVASIPRTDNGKIQRHLLAGR